MDIQGGSFFNMARYEVSIQRQKDEFVEGKEQIHTGMTTEKGLIQA